MKKPLPIILIILLVISIIGNIFLYKQLKEAGTENKSLTSSLAEAQETLESIESEQKDLEEQLNNLETERKGLEEEQNTLQSEIEQAEAKQAEAKQAQEQLQTKANSTEEQVEFTEERYQYFSKMMQEDPENKTGWQDDYSYDEVVEYITRDVMKDYMPSGGSSGHIDAPTPEGWEKHDSSEGGNEPMQLTDHPEFADVQIQ